MLHLTTEIGLPGKNERERRHYPNLFNQPGCPEYSPQGRVYIPHGRSEEIQFRPHPPHQDPEYTINGLDWKSRLRYIPCPKPDDYRAYTEIWPTPWKSLRAFPGQSQRTKEEWSMYREGYDVALRCKWDGSHRASSLSENEITHTMLFGKGRKLPMIDKRNGLKQASPGDKDYQAVEYSLDFHKMGSTRPVINFGGNVQIKPDTFVPLEAMPTMSRLSFVVKDKQRLYNEDAKAVRNLESWRPATPLVSQSAQPVIHEEPKYLSVPH